MLLNYENPAVLEDNILFMVLIGKRNFHTYVLSDQEINRWRINFKNLVNKHEGCHEAYFGLAKIYFHLNKLETASDCINKAIQIQKNDHIYHLWKGLILFYIVSFNNSQP